jgi:hypothetical protein
VRRALAAVVVLAVAVAAGVAFARTQDDPRGALAQALDSVPEATLTANFTDWAQVRDILDMAEVSSSSPAAEREALATAAYEQDLSTASALLGSVDGMADRFGWSVLDARWEVFAQARQGAVSVVSLEPSVDLGELTATLERLGYRPPSAGAEDGGVWHGGGDVLAGIDPQPSPALAQIAVLADRRIVVASDDEAYATATVEVITSGEGAVGGVGDVAATALPLYGDAVAVVHQAWRACDITSFATADDSDQREAAQRAEQAGGLVAQRTLGFGLRRQSGGLVLDVVLRFASAGEAVDQAKVRGRLATGEATGQGGTYDERFTLTRQAVEDETVMLELEPVTQPMSLLSDLTTGPLLFTWCGPGDSAPV